MLNEKEPVDLVFAENSARAKKEITFGSSPKHKGND